MALGRRARRVNYVNVYSLTVRFQALAHGAPKWSWTRRISEVEVVRALAGHGVAREILECRSVVAARSYMCRPNTEPRNGRPFDPLDHEC